MTANTRFSVLINHACSGVSEHMLAASYVGTHPNQKKGEK